VADKRLETKRADWERAEVERSAHEAALMSAKRLRLDPTQERRYVSPPAETAYPLEYAYHLLGDVRDKVVLDFGCGSGENTVLLCRRGARVGGMDLSEDLVRIARRRLELNGLAGQAHLCVASAHDLPFDNGSIDVIFGIAILHHLNLARVAAEVQRVLRPGVGRAIFKEPVRNSALLRWARGLIPYHAPDVSPFERPLLDDEIADFAERAQLSPRRSRAFMLPHVQLANVLPGLRRRTDPFYRADAAILRRIPAAERFAAIRVVEFLSREELPAARAASGRTVGSADGLASRAHLACTTSSPRILRQPSSWRRLQ
jgi:2-polyprenyl-3-methyl-5-hydroxy-6-metoxy-1,4-benzoquinol methylase